MSDTAPTTDISTQQTLAFIWRILMRKPASLCLIIAGISLAVLPDVLLPTFTGYMSEGVIKNDASFALYGFYGVISCAIISFLIRRSTDRQFHIKLIEQRVALEVEAFDHIQHASTDWHINNFSGKTINSIFRGSNFFDSFVTILLHSLFTELLFLSGALLMMWLKWPLLGCAATISFALYIAAAHYLTEYYLKNIWKEEIEKGKEISAAYADSISCNIITKCFGAEKRELAHIQTKQTDYVRIKVRSLKLSMRYDDMRFGLTLLNRLTLLGIPFYLWQSGQAGGDVMMYGLTVYYQVSNPLSQIAQNINRAKEFILHVQDLIRFEELPKALADVQGAKEAVITQGEIDVQHVSFAYPSQKEKLIYKDLSLHIGSGARVGLVGASGSGKSTLIKLIQRLYDLNAGRILIDGQDIALVQQSSLRRQIALVPQDPVLFHRSLMDNIRYAKPEATEAEVMRAAAMAHAHEFITKLPEGYNTLVGERGVKLSGGERQRVAIARAILADTPILVLDEATSSLDSVSEALIQEALESLMQNRTTLIVAHRLSTLRAVDRILVFDNGQIVESGTHEALMAIKDGRYKQLYDTQQLKGFAEIDLETVTG